MSVTNRPLAAVFLSLCALALPAAAIAKDKPAKDKPATGPAVMWNEPKDIASRDLYYGPGGRNHAPHGPFTFVKEDLEGTNPKFEVKDPDGVKWKVKLGIEARPETVASRLVWAVGYRADDDYFLPNLQIQGLPVRLHRGRNFVGPDGTVHDVRVKRESDEKKLGDWKWRHDAFSNTRELNGLRTLMAVINNWDLKDVNNAIREDHGERIYYISDLGASFGASSRAWPKDKAKGNLEAFEASRFIRQTNDRTIDFSSPGRPAFEYLVNPKEYIARVHLEWIGKNVPRADAKWMGNLLARLSPAQIHDAFRAAGYSTQDADAFYAVLSRRIAALTDL